jgi:hypothetical protein
MARGKPTPTRTKGKTNNEPAKRIPARQTDNDDSPTHAPESGEPTETGKRSLTRGSGKSRSR